MLASLSFRQISTRPFCPLDNMTHSATSCTTPISIHTRLHACIPTRFTVSIFIMAPAIGDPMRNTSAVVSYGMSILVPSRLRFGHTLGNTAGGREMRTPKNTPSKRLEPTTDPKVYRKRKFQDRRWNVPTEKYALSYEPWQSVNVNLHQARDSGNHAAYNPRQHDSEVMGES